MDENQEVKPGGMPGGATKWEPRTAHTMHLGGWRGRHRFGLDLGTGKVFFWSYDTYAPDDLIAIGEACQAKLAEVRRG